MIIANPDKNYFSMYWEQKKKKYDLKVHLKENEKSSGKIWWDTKMRLLSYSMESLKSTKRPALRDGEAVELVEDSHSPRWNVMGSTQPH